MRFLYILHPALIKKLTKSFISGSIAQFDKVVFPLANAYAQESSSDEARSWTKNYK